MALFFINCVKVPIYAGLTMFDSSGTKMLTADGLWLNLMLAPSLIIGAATGRWLLPKIPQGIFDRWVIAVAAVAACRLMLSPWW